MEKFWKLKFLTGNFFFCHILKIYTHSVPSSLFCFADTDYISQEELAKVEQMLGHLSEESKQAAAATLVSILII